MPTVLRVKGFDVRINTADHEPPHVHIYNAEGMVKIYLDPIVVKSRVGMSTRMATKAELIVHQYQTMLLDAWREIHG